MAKTYWLLMVLLLALGTAGYRAHVRRAAMLARITALDACLTIRNGQRAQEAAGTVGNIAKQVSRNHNLAMDVAVLKESQQIQARTKLLADTLRQLRQQWQARSSVESGKLPAHLTSYWQFIRRYVPDAIPLTQESSQNQDTGWLGQFDLTAEPLPAALATLTRLETQVRQYEAEALTKQTLKVASCCCVFDKISVFAFPTSQTVAPGTVYEARLMLTESAVGFGQHLSADGRELPIDPRTSHGLVGFRVPAARPSQPDTVQATWRGAIRFNYHGRDSTLLTQVPYFIAKCPTP